MIHNNTKAVPTKYPLVKYLYIQQPPAFFSHSFGHFQGGDTKNKKFQDCTIFEVSEPVQDIRR
jgi:hypothetical protein